jgi:hypothetical protein
VNVALLVTLPLLVEELIFVDPHPIIEGVNRSLHFRKARLA